MKKRESTEAKNGCYMNSPAGILYIEEDGKGICKVHFTGQKQLGDKKNLNLACVAKELTGEADKKADMQAWEGLSDLLKQAVSELREYFSGERREFTVPLSSEGTEFQMKVWEQLKKIPYGETTTYGEIAKRVGNPKASRAVGMANNKNPIAIIVPCHRVIGKNGTLTGYEGGVDIKKMLLELEEKNI